MIYLDGMTCSCSGSVSITWSIAYGSEEPPDTPSGVPAVTPRRPGGPPVLAAVRGSDGTWAVT